MQLSALYVVKTAALSATSTVLSKLQDSSKLLSLLPSLYILMHKAPVLDACYTVRKVLAAVFENQLQRCAIQIMRYWVCEKCVKCRFVYRQYACYSLIYLHLWYFRSVRKIEKNGYKLRPVCLSVRPFVQPRERTWLSPDEFTWNVMFNYVWKICREN